MTTENTFPSSLSFISFARDSISSIVDCVFILVSRAGVGPKSSSSSSWPAGATEVVVAVGGRTGPMNEDCFGGGVDSPPGENSAGKAGPNSRSDDLSSSFSDNLRLPPSGRSESWLDEEEFKDDGDEWRRLRSWRDPGGTSADGVSDGASDGAFVKPGGSAGP